MNRIISKVAIFVAIFGLISLVGCKDDPADPILTEDGTYIQGVATNYTDFDVKASLNITKNEVTQENRNDLVEIYVPIKAAGGFNIIEVAGSTQTTYGPGADFATDVVGGTNDEPIATFQRGAYAEGTTTFTVPADGLYHIVMDKEVKTIAIIPVEYWGLIGGATPGGWGADTQLPSTGFAFDRMVFTASDIAMTTGDFKFRYGGGWKVEIDSSYEDAVGNIGIKANTNLGGAVDALLPGGDNINNAESGYYTATMTWLEGAGMSATMARTGDLPSMDWTAIELGLIGDGLTVAGAPHNWDGPILLNMPTVSGSVYTYAFDGVTVNTAGSFKIREGLDWSGQSLGHPQVVMAGTGAAEFDTNADGNFVPTVDAASYDLLLEIDAATEVYTLTATKL